jgi:hypothetical protein
MAKAAKIAGEMSAEQERIADMAPTKMPSKIALVVISRHYLYMGRNGAPTACFSQTPEKRDSRKVGFLACRLLGSLWCIFRPSGSW